LIGQHDVREDRSGLELEVLPAVGVLHDDVGADDVGRHQIGSELHAREGEVEAFRQRLDEQRFTETGDTFQEHVATGEHAGEHVGDDLAMSDDDLLDLAPQALEGRHEFPHPSVLTHSWSPFERCGAAEAKLLWSRALTPSTDDGPMSPSVLCSCDGHSHTDARPPTPPASGRVLARYVALPPPSPRRRIRPLPCKSCAE